MTLNQKTIFLALLVLCIITTTATVYAFSDASINRPQTNYNISPATNNTTTTLIDISQKQMYHAGETNTSFLEITNNYDEQVSITLQLSNNNWQFTETNTQTQTITIPPTVTETTYVAIQGGNGGSGTTCDSQTRTYSYTYSVSGETMTIQQTTEDTTICGGAGPPGGGSRPPATDVYTISANGHQEKVFEVSQGQNPTWQFGDGTTGTGYYISHQYPADGNYTTTLDVTINGQQYTYTDTVEIGGVTNSPEKPPAADVYTISNPSWTTENTRTFEIAQGQNPTISFGDGTTQNTYWVNYEYNSTGTYEATIEVTIDGTRYKYTETISI